MTIFKNLPTIYWQRQNNHILENATKFRIVPITTSLGRGYIIEGYVPIDTTEAEWQPLKGTFCQFWTEDHRQYPNCEYAYNKCKKIAFKLQYIKMNELIQESGFAAWCYGMNDGSEYIPTYINNEDLIFNPVRTDLITKCAYM